MPRVRRRIATTAVRWTYCSSPPEFTHWSVAITARARDLLCAAHGRPARALPRDARLHDHAGAARSCGDEKGKGAALLHPASRGDAPALRLPARAAGRAEELGRAEGAEPGSGRQAPCDAARGPSVGLWRVRGRDPGEAVWRGRGAPLGQGRLDGRGA